MTTMIRVETKKTANNIDISLERTNCLFGLKQAIARIQKHTGKDQSTTARAEILIDKAKNNAANSRWIGVWNTDPQSDNYGEHEAWLVSSVKDGGRLSDYERISNTNSVILEKAGNKESKDITVTTKALDEDGAYAWWVDDEGLKHYFPYISENWANESSPYNYLSATKTGLNGIPLFQDLNITNAKTQEQLLKSLNSGNLKFVNGIDSTNLRKSNYREYLTAYSHGVFSNTKNGGLQFDLTSGLQNTDSTLEKLSESEQIFPGSGLNNNWDPGGPMWSQIRGFYNLTSSGSYSDTIAPSPLTDKHPLISPIMSQFNLWFYPILVREAGGKQWIRILIYPQLTLWNPYNITIRNHTYYLRLGRNRRKIHHTGSGLFQGIPPSATVDMKRNDDKIWIGGGRSTVNKISNTKWKPVDQLIPQLGHPVNTEGTTDLLNKWEFGIECPDIPPGKAIVFSPSGNTEYINSITGDSTTNYLQNLVKPGLQPDNYLYIDTTLKENAWKFILGIHLQINWDTDTGLTLARDHLEADTKPLQDWQRLYAYTNHSRGESYWNIYGKNIYRTDASNTPNIDLGEGVDHRPLIGWVMAPKRQSLSFTNVEDAQKLKFLAHADYRAPLQMMTAMDYSHEDSNTKIGGTPPNIAMIAKWAQQYESLPVVGEKEGLVGFDNESNTRAILFDVPRSEKYFTSIGSLYHAPMSRPIKDNYFEFYGYQNYDDFRPTYPIGNSLAHPLTGKNEITRIGGNSTRVNYDWSYHLNDALWDKYFFSTLNFDNKNLEVLDSRKRIIDHNDSYTKTVDQAAKNLLLKGAFNINSTSEESWIAFFSTLKGTPIAHLDLNETPTVTPNKNRTPFAPYSYIHGREVDDSVYFNDEEAFSGFRTIGTKDINELAKEMVNEVKSRGPFLSLSHFINRSIDSNDPVAFKLRGAMQAAIDRTSINSNFIKNIDSSTYESRYGTNKYDTDALGGNILEGMPAHLTQGKILQRMGNMISARSDTFRIRAYGEGPNRSKALCEAIVQRLPEYVDSSKDSAEKFPPSNNINHKFGRKYQIVSFQWLSPQ